MLMIVFDVLVTAYQGILLLYVIKRQVMQPTHSAFYDIAMVLAFTLFFAVIQYINLPVSENFVTMILFIYIKLTSHTRWLPCLLWSIMDVFLLMGTLTLVSSLFDMQIYINGTVAGASNETRVLYYLVGTAAVTVVMNIAAHFSKPTYVISAKETLLFILMLLLSFFINECFFMARLSGNEDISLLIGSACSFTVMVITMILYNQLTESTKKQRQMELAAQTAQLVEEHQEELKTIYIHMLAEQHDLRNRIAAAEELLSDPHVRDAQRSEALSLLKTDASPHIFTTGCIAVDAILKAKATLMENAGIAFEFTDYPLSPLPISEQSFCMLLGNLLDNAIEGVLRLPVAASSKMIHLSFSKVWNMLFITCVNDANLASIKRQGDLFISSKEHPERHGFGTISMRNIVENAGGHIEFEMEAGKFTVQIMLGDASLCS